MLPRQCQLAALPPCRLPGGFGDETAPGRRSVGAAMRCAPLGAGSGLHGPMASGEASPVRSPHLARKAVRMRITRPLRPSPVARPLPVPGALAASWGRLGALGALGWKTVGGIRPYAAGVAWGMGEGVPPWGALAPSAALRRPPPAPFPSPAPSRPPGGVSGPWAGFRAALARPLARWLAGARRPGGDGVCSGLGSGRFPGGAP